MLPKKTLFQRTLISRLVATSLLALGADPLLAASQWDCRVSADGTTWDCYQDGNLVVQPMPKPATPAVATSDQIVSEEVSITAASESTSVPDQPLSQVTESTSTETAAATATATAVAAEAAAKSDKQEIEKIIRQEEQAYSETRTESQPAKSSVQPTEKPVEQQETATAIGAKPEPVVQGSATETASDSVSVTTASETITRSSKPAASAASGRTATLAPISEAETSACARPSRVQVPVKSAEPTDTHIQSDDAQFDDNTGIANFSGNVILEQGEQTVVSDKVRYNTQTADVHAEGSLDYRRSDLMLQGSSADLNLNTDAGQVNDAIYRLPATRARGEAETANLHGNGVSTYKNVSYTTCAPGNNDWIFNAAELELDENTGEGVAKNMTLEFMDVPVFYLPWATFPIDDRRKSGFLTPSIGTSDQLGADIIAPYYFNLAPNYDATLTPRIMSERGLMIGGELRYLNEYSLSQFNGEILPDDQDYAGNDPRGAAHLENSTQFNDRLTGKLNLNYVSDDTYLEDFGGSLAATSETRLERRGVLNYRGGDYSVSATLLDYQVISGAEPYKKLPQIHFNSGREIADTDFSADLVADYTYFDHELDSKAKGSRFDIYPSLEYNWNRSWGFIKPKGTVRYTSYDLTDHTFNNQNVSSVDRTTATLSLDSGLIFERDASWFGESATQTLEPRLFYVYTPEENQDDIPLFDTGRYTFNSAMLFRENRFTGSDRVGDANQLTAAVTSRFLSGQTGQQYLSATFGTILYFEDREVYLNTNDPAEYTENNSSYVLGLSSKPYDNWIADAYLQMDNDFREAEKGYIRAKFADSERHLFSARYQYEGATNEYTKLSAYWPIGDNFNAVGHSYYQIADANNDSRRMETVAGFEYGSSCCWRVRTLLREFYLGKDAITGDDDYDFGFFVQLQLSGFTSIGDDIDTFLEDTMEGFVRETY